MSASDFRLIVRSGPNPGTVFDLTKEVTVLGRDVGNDIVIGDVEISRQHARLTRTPTGFVLEDLGSTNGSFVNGDRLTSPRVLNPGDLLGFGENVTVTFDATAPAAAATVMGHAARSAPPQRAYAPPPPPAPGMAPAAPAEAAPARDNRKWIFAGCGCLFLLVACAAVLTFLPCEWYLPITSLFGFSYCP